jgi:hypothetical protein
MTEANLAIARKVVLLNCWALALEKGIANIFSRSIAIRQNR